MHKQLTLFILSLAGTGFIYSQPASVGKREQIALANTSSITLTDKAISVTRSQFHNLPTGTIYPLIFSAKGDSIPAQLDDLDGDGKWDELFFVANLQANATESYFLQWTTTPISFVKRTSVRFGKRLTATEHVQPAASEIVYRDDMPKKMGFQRYQTDGPSWENDKVGFRHYLDGRNANDVFGKRVTYMSPETVGINAAGAVEDNYHVMEAWGRDIMAVSNSVGLGGVALLKHDSIMRLGIIAGDTISNIERTNFHIVTEGPVRSMMNFKYNNWKPVYGTYSVNETTSIWPGMYAYHNAVQVSGLEGDENILIGMVSIFATKPPELIRISDKWVALLSHAKNTYNQEWWLGLALLLPADEYLGFIEAPKAGQLSNSFLARMKPGKESLEYYGIACWEISDERFKDPAYFRQYVLDLGKQVSAEVKVKVTQ